MAGVLVFRCFAADGTLLHVGFSNTVFMHPPQQRRRQYRWWPTVARVVLEEWPDRSNAARVHAEAIRVERPSHNHLSPACVRLPVCSRCGVVGDARR